MNSKPILFSGIQPSGSLGIGHYFGVIQHWLRYQTSNQCFFSVVDLHALTVKQDPQLLHRQSLDLLAWYLACGLDPKEHVLFVQSHVRAHTELCWLLSTVTPMGALNRMTQFKDKSQQFAQNINAGLFTYPILMAADILLYGTEMVPVGEDQKQHLELARDIAERFNQQYEPVFIVPEPVIAKTGARIMSLQDPNKKMSKSDPNQNSTLLLSDTSNMITSKIKRAVTDSEACVAYDPNRPGISNLMTLMHAVSGDDYAAIELRYAGQGYGVFKSDLAAALVELIVPIQARFAAIREDEATLLAVMRSGAERAEAHAQHILCRAKAAMGLIAL